MVRLLTGKMQKSMFLITDCTTQVVSLREKGFMMEKYSDLRNILKDYFIQLKEWELKFLILKKQINEACKSIINIQKVTNGYVRPVIWRGSEMMAISAQKNKIHVAIAAWEWGSYFDPKLKLKGIKLNISSWRRPNPNSVPWDTKAAGLYMICTLSKHEAESKGFTDSLMLDHEGNVAEATGANIFFKNNEGELHTPTPDSFLNGITRREVIKIAKNKGIKVVEKKIKPEDMKNYIGCFLTGTAAEITPVSQIDNYNFKICSVITDLNDSYQALVRKKSAA